MRTVAAVLVLVAAVAGCSSTTDTPEPERSASTVVQQDINDFCADVQDAISNRESADPEDLTERLNELQEAAQQLGQGTRDDMYAADALTKCEQQLQDALNNP